jgi:hypothetical protein
MSRAANILEQDVGGGEGDNLPTYENLAAGTWPEFKVRSQVDFEAHCIQSLSCRAGSAGGKAG